MREIKLACKDLAEAIYSSGDLSTDFFQNNDQNDGKKAHLYLQHKYNDGDIMEYFVKKVFSFEDYEITLTGFIDGVLNNQTLLEEIKSTSLPLTDITLDYHQEHLSQLKLYAYLFMDLNNKTSIDTRLRYISLDKYETLDFLETFTINELEIFFNETIKEYMTFYKEVLKTDDLLKTTAKSLEFPFKNYRKGQRDFMKYIYQTIKDKDILFAIAPTGIGKTMGSLFSSLKTINEDVDKIFYLTAKSLGKDIALNSIKILINNGLKIKAIELSSKDKMCHLQERNCDPEVCPYAKGYFDRLKEAINDLYLKNDLWTSPLLKEVALQHKICAFEFSLDLSYYAHIIVCDYNYAFDPRAHLMRYFDDDKYMPILLVDEAHNLVSRSKEMYSASIMYEALVPLRRALSKVKPSSRTVINHLIDYLDEIKSETAEVKFYVDEKYPDKLMELIVKLTRKIEEVLEKNKVFKRRIEVVETYFDLMKFIKISEFYDENFRYIIENKDDLVISIKCLNASKFLLNIMQNKAYGTILFSATMHPLKYYQKLLTNDYGETLVIPSPFNPSNLHLVIKNDTSTKYIDRDKSVDEIIKTIDVLTSYKKGNYIVFFPSYAYLNLVFEKLKDKEYEIIIQKSSLTEEERLNTVELFKNNDKTQVALFVMGGVFAEGIDYLGDMLSGVLIVSAALPVFGDYNNLLSSYYDKTIGDGFNYAYTYPGFTKVVQAVGRVIRTETDRGIAILFDSRFNNFLYKSLMPVEWRNRVLINDLNLLKESIKEFKEEENG